MGMTQHTEMDFIAISDPHFDIDLAGYDRREELFEVWNAVLDYAEKEKIRDVLIAGDLFHRNKPSPKTVAEFIDSIVGRKKLQLEVIGGNHDAHMRLQSSALAPLNSFRSPRYNFYVKPEMGSIGSDDRINVPCFFAPYPVNPDYDDDARKLMKYWDCIFGVGHFNLPNAEVGDGLHLTDPGGKVFPDYLDQGGIFINGHYHFAQEVQLKKTKVIVPGSLIRLNFGDKTEKTFLRLRAVLKKGVFTNLKWERVETPKVKRLIVLKVDLRKKNKIKLPSQKTFKNSVVRVDCVMDATSDVTEFYAIQDKMRKWADHLMPSTPKVVSVRVADERATLKADLKPEKALEQFVNESSLDDKFKKTIVKKGTGILERLAD